MTAKFQLVIDCRDPESLAPVGHADAGIPDGIRDAPDASRGAHQGGNRG
jgi:hypothetical protein